MTDRYAVMGNPIGHSKSPRIHALFATQTGQTLIYEALLVEVDAFAEAVTAFASNGGRGLNVTVPFKQDAWDLEAKRSRRAELAGAVNTIVIHEDGSYSTDTTDGVGLVRDLTSNHSLVLRNRRVLVLGAGGAVRGVLEPLLAESPQRLVVANRTASKAHELAELFGELGPISGCGFDELAGQRFDLVINGTAASLEGKVPPLPDDLLAVGAACYDMMYSAEPTAFQLWAGEHGAVQALDGLGMLVEQAAESFSIWRGVRPETKPVIELLRSEISTG